MFWFLPTLILALSLLAASALDAEEQRCYPPSVGDPNERYSYFEAKKASEGGYIVLHYGEGIHKLSMKSAVRYFREHSYPVVAMAGGPDESVRVLINGQSSSEKFGQTDVHNGFLADSVMVTYDRLLADGRVTRPLCEHSLEGAL